MLAEEGTARGHTRTHALGTGLRVERADGRTLYRFQGRELPDIFEDARLELLAGGRAEPATLVSLGAGGLDVAVSRDLGDRVRDARLVVSDTRLTEALLRDLDAVEAGEGPVDARLADAVVEGWRLVPPDPVPRAAGAAADGLDPDQRAAMDRALRQAVTYLLGPPGTGKTRTLAAIVGALAAAGRRVLVVANTNGAVDGVLARVWRNGVAGYPAAGEAGAGILRLGRIAAPMDGTDYAEAVSYDRLAERARQAVLADRPAIRARRAEREAALSRALSARTRRDERDALERRIAMIGKEIAGLDQESREAEAIADRQRSLLDTLAKERRVARRAGPLARLIRRSVREVEDDIAWVRYELDRAEASARERAAALEAARRRLEAARLALRDLDEAAVAAPDPGSGGGIDGGMDGDLDIEGHCAAVEAARAEVAALDDRATAARASVLASARVVGATATKAHLAARSLGPFDAAVVDEASMIALPALYLVAGLARERVVVCGDAGQLPPILRTRKEAIRRVLGGDVFRAAGAGDPAEPHPAAALLTVQRRMAAPICALIDGPIYGGRLVTAPEEAAAPRHAPPPELIAPSRLAVIDSSALGSRQSVDADGSRFNMTHALIARALVERLAAEGRIEDGTDIGLCTPYAAQGRLIRRLLAERGLDGRVTCDTVHGFQGADRRIMVLETPDAEGDAGSLGPMARDAAPDGEGARQLNVAISRARDALVVIADLAWLDRTAPADSMMRGVLDEIRSQGRVIDARTLLAGTGTEPVAAESPSAGGATDRPAEASGDSSSRLIRLCDAAAFTEAVRDDIEAATRSVVVFSAFVTPKRVEDYLDLFHRKTAEGVAIRCVTRPPFANGSMSAARTAETLDRLEAAGCIVDTREQTHEKVVIVDDRIVWHGSLNVLSNTDRTDELMTGVVGRDFAEETARLLARVRRGDDGPSGASAAENPRCPSCGGRTYLAGRSARARRPRFACEAGCESASGAR